MWKQVNMKIAEWTQCTVTQLKTGAWPEIQRQRQRQCKRILSSWFMQLPGGQFKYLLGLAGGGLQNKPKTCLPTSLGFGRQPPHPNCSEPFGKEWEINGSLVERIESTNKHVRVGQCNTLDLLWCDFVTIYFKLANCLRTRKWSKAERERVECELHIFTLFYFYYFHCSRKRSDTRLQMLSGGRRFGWEFSSYWRSGGGLHNW